MKPHMRVRVKRYGDAWWVSCWCGEARKMYDWYAAMHAACCMVQDHAAPRHTPTFFWMDWWLNYGWKAVAP